MHEVGAEELKEDLIRFWRSAQKLVGLPHKDQGAWLWSEGSDDDMPDSLSGRRSSQKRLKH